MSDRLGALQRKIIELQEELASLRRSEYIARAGTADDADLLQGLAPDDTGAADAHVVATDANGNLLTQSITQSTAIAASVYRSTNQLTSNATTATIEFSHARWDDRPTGVAAQWDSGDPTKLTCRVAGWYIITANVEYASNATGRRILTIQLNGNTPIASVVSNATTDTVTRMAVARAYKLSVGAYVDVRVHQQSGGDLYVVSASNYSPELAWTRIA